MFHPGNYYYMTHWNDVLNRTATLTVENAAFANQGIYSASYVGDSPLHGAWMRLIVRGWCDSYMHKWHFHENKCLQPHIYRRKEMQLLRKLVDLIKVYWKYDLTKVEASKKFKLANRWTFLALHHTNEHTIILSLIILPAIYSSSTFI